MPNQGIDDEIRKNKQRQVENESNTDDDGGIVDSFEKAVDPIMGNLRENSDDAPDDDDIARQRTLNDAAQRPD